MPKNPEMTSREFLHGYLRIRPVSTALWRTAEFIEFKRLKIKPPLLDLGCGDGLFAMQLFGKGIEAGIDLNREEVGLAVKKGVYKRVYVQNARRLPFPTNHFNTVFSNCVMEHVGPLDEVLREIRRVLKRGGKFVFTVPGDHFNRLLFYPRIFRAGGLKAMGDWYTRSLNKSLAHVQVEGPVFWEKRLEKAGLKLVYSNYFMPHGAMAFFDITILWGAPSKLWRRYFNRWTIFPRFWWVWLWEGFFYRLLMKKEKVGGGLILVAQK